MSGGKVNLSPTLEASFGDHLIEGAILLVREGDAFLAGPHLAKYPFTAG